MEANSQATHDLQSQIDANSDDVPSSLVQSMLRSIVSLHEKPLIVFSATGKIVATNQPARSLLSVHRKLLNDTAMSLYVKETQQLLSFLSQAKRIDNLRLHLKAGCEIREVRASMSPIASEKSKPSAGILLVHDEVSPKATAPSSLRREAEIQVADFDELLGSDPSFEYAKHIAFTLGPSDNALIVGEPGTGKSTFAQVIHKHSSGNGPLIVCNCASLALVDPVVYLFGYSHDGETSKGLIEMADGGTLLLEDIEDLPFSLQHLFLRSNDHKEVVRDADFKIIHSTFRIIATSTRPPSELIAEEKLLPALYYRLAESEITTSPLRERQSDIPLLIRRIIECFCDENNRALIRCAPEALETLLAYSWPGNIRELAVVIRAACEICRRSRIELHDLPSTITGRNTETYWSRGEASATPNLQAAKEERIELALQMTNNNVPEAAALLGMGRSTLYKHLKKRANKA